MFIIYRVEINLTRIYVRRSIDLLIETKVILDYFEYASNIKIAMVIRSLFIISRYLACE